MVNKLSILKENFKRELCPVVSVMKNIMAFFLYDIKDIEYYGLGNDYIISYPFLISQEQQIRSMFHYVRELCYANGTWYIEYISGHKDSFIQKLNDKWDEWVNAHQPMPIFVVIPERKSKIIMPYILIGLDSEHTTYEFLNCMGDTEVYTLDDINLMQAEQYGYATCHVPGNFMVKSKYYRSIDNALDSSFVKTKYNLKNGIVQDTLNNLISSCQKGNYSRIYNFIENYINIKKISGYEYYYDGYSYSRIEYGQFLQMYGGKINRKDIYKLGENYIRLGGTWKRLFTADFSNSDEILRMVEDICKEELTCIKTILSL